jgi:hypothetical protein
MFPNAPNPDTRVKQVREWLKDRGVLDLEPVSLFAEQLDKVRWICVRDILLLPYADDLDPCYRPL